MKIAWSSVHIKRIMVSNVNECTVAASQLRQHRGAHGPSFPHLANVLDDTTYWSEAKLTNRLGDDLKLAY